MVIELLLRKETKKQRVKFNFSEKTLERMCGIEAMLMYEYLTTIGFDLKEIGCVFESEFEDLELIISRGNFYIQGKHPETKEKWKSNEYPLNFYF